MVTVLTEVMSMAGATPMSPPLLHGLLLEVSGHEMSGSSQSLQGLSKPWFCAHDQGVSLNLPP